MKKEGLTARISYLLFPLGQMVIDGKGIAWIGTCHTAVTTGFCCHPLKHSSIQMMENIKPTTTMNNQRNLEYQRWDEPR